MPYRRSSRPRRRYPKKSRGSKWGGYLSTASKALAVAYGVKKLINVERKYVVTSASTTFTTTPEIIPLSLIAQGDGETARDGNKVKAQGLSVKMQLKGGNSRTFARVILFTDKDSTGNAPSASAVLESTTTLGHYNNVNCPYRFRILKDDLIPLEISTNDGNTKVRKYYCKMNHHITFSGSTAVQANANCGQVYMMLIGDVLNDGSCEYSARLSFTDN